MRLDRLRLKGINCFAAPVDLDFTTIAPGLIAIVGPNGSGKTTLMEAFAGAVYGELPTRGPVANYATEKDSYLDITTTFDASGSYRARRTIDGVKGGQSAVLERLETGERLNDGKVTTFKGAIDQRFPALDTLLASAMAVQNRRGSFAARDKRERTELFYALLGLDRYERWATSARASAGLLEKRMAELRGQLEVLRGTTSDELHEQLQAQAYALTADLATAEDTKRALERQLAVVDAPVVTLQADVEAKASALLAHATVTASLAECRHRAEFYAEQLTTIAKDREDDEKAIAGRLSSTLAQIARERAALPTDEQIDGDLQASLDHVDSELGAFVAGREVKIANYEALLAQEADITAAVATITAARTEIDRLRVAIDEHRARRTAAEREQREAERDVTRLEMLIGERDRAHRSATFLETVPCGGIPPFDGCGFLREAVTAKARAAELVGMDLDATVESARVSVTLAKGAVADIDHLIAHATGDIGVAQRSIEAHQALASRQPDLALATERVALRRKEIADARATADRQREQLRAAAATAKSTRDTTLTQLTARDADARATAHTETAALDARHRDATAKRQADVDANQQTIAALETQLAGMADATGQHAAAAADLAAKDAERRRLAADLAAADKAFALVQENVAHLKRRQDEFAAAHAQRVALEAGLGTLEAHLLDWQVLAQMFGREGLPVLEIDAAGPGVSDGANDLLQASFGGRFAVELITQDVKADGKGMKEVFALQVYDHERGGEARDLADLSGGEQVIVDSALRLAIAAWINRRNEQPIRTVWLDETTGALDPENAQRYLAMLRRLHERAGLHHLIVVSHNPSVSSQADVQIQVGDGKAAFVYPPFAPATASQEAA